MPKYDKDTQAFMDKVAGKKPPEPPEPDASDQVQNVAKTLTTLKTIASGNPAAIINRTVAMPIARKVMELRKPDEVPAFQKQGAAGLNVLEIYAHLNQRYKRSWWDWEPETLWKTLAIDLDVEADDDLKNTVQALQLILNTNAAHENWHIFEKVGQAFNQNVVDFGTLQPLELNEIAFTHRVLERIRPEQNYEPEVCGYIAAAAKEAGVVYLYPKLFPETCQPFLDENLGNNMELKAEVEKYMQDKDWPYPAKHLKPPLIIQALRMKEIQEYVDERS